MKYMAALYMRLSKDDGQNESVGIGAQRRILTAYSKEHGFEIADEYVDDGYSGTNFERPAFKRMIEDIENKRINLVLTKDLSRLGRNYITTGEYTEIYFPGKGVRYIAVGDGYDSANANDDIAPFRHVVNEMYARDISRKIRSSLYARMKDGVYIGNFAPYGYEKDSADKGRLVIDTEVFEVVRAIFSLAANGCSTRMIADFLNESKTPCPLVYRCQKYGLNITNYTRFQNRGWIPSTVRKIIRNEVYIGNTVQHKTTKPSFKLKTSLVNPSGDWIRVEGTHEAIIDSDTFIQAQKSLSQTKHGNGYRM